MHRNNQPTKATLMLITGSITLALLLGSGLLPSVPGRESQISNVAVSDITHRIVTISWQTKIDATTQVIYGPTVNYGQTAGAIGITSHHKVIITGLEPETSYHFRVISADASGQTASSEDGVFTTAAIPNVPSSFPSDFQPPVDATTERPMPGFGGGSGVLYHDPIIFIHGNGESAEYWLGLSRTIPRLLFRFTGPEPIPGGGDVQAENILGRFIAEGYTPAEVWSPSYLGEDGLNNGADPFGSSFGHSHEANTSDIGAFIEAVLDYTGAKRVDIIAHSLGVTLVRNWIRQELDNGIDVLSKLDDVVLIAGANHGVQFCGFPFVTGREPPSQVVLCEEVGCTDSPFLLALNVDETPQVNERPNYLTIFAVGESEDFAYPAEGVDSMNRMVNLRLSPVLNGAVNVGLAFALPQDPRFPVVIPGDPPIDFGDPRAHYLLGVSEQAFQIIFPFVNNLRE